MSEKNYKECVIESSYSGFGEYQAGEYNGESWDSAEDILSEITATGLEYYELGVDKLPEEIEDIRGSIHYQPDRVFAWVDDQQITGYFGISEFTE